MGKFERDVCSVINPSELRELIFATRNSNKVREIQSLVGGQFILKTLDEAGIDIEIPEPYDTLEENARIKAETIYRLTGLAAFGEDTGLEVAALGNRPGVHSARYSGVQPPSDAANIQRLLQELKGTANRSARFRTIICLIHESGEELFEGICEGEISTVPTGIEGFGYDPVFIPYGSNRTFAEMRLEEKNAFSHRKKAVVKLVSFLQNLSERRPH